MASITAQARGAKSQPLRPLNILRDLPQVADLIELCFSSSMDDEGQSYLQQMRRAGGDHNFLSWAAQVVDSAALPMTGYVWEENGRIVGNASLIPHRYQGRRITLIANVATHPDHRGRGIARALTERALSLARSRGAQELWLQVREENATAIRIYTELGFVERARRTTYRSGGEGVAQASAPGDLNAVPPGVIIGRPERHDWPQQRAWLQRAHPDELGWYARWDWNVLGPGIWPALKRLLVEADFRQWAAFREGRLLATLTWLPTARSSSMLWAAVAAEQDGAGLTAVLQTARRAMAYYRRLSLEHPAGELAEAVRAAGFTPQRTLIWMRALA